MITHTALKNRDGDNDKFPCQVMVKLVAHELNIPVNRFFIGILLHKSHGKKMNKGHNH